VALLLQSLTYVAQGEIWRGVGRRVGFHLEVAVAGALSLAKLFVDQAIPSGGVSGTVVLARSLEARGMPRPAVMAGVVVNLASFYAAFMASLAVALVIAGARRQATAPILLASGTVVLLAVAIAGSALALAGRPPPGWIARLRPAARFVRPFEVADRGLSHSPALIAEATAYQVAIVLLDVATLWLLIVALGHSPPLAGVFASFLISTVFRTIGILPGGLGSFEAASVLTLRIAGIPLPVALAATLLFRGLTFWLPMVPGLWFTRHAAFRPRRRR
jgi:Mg2+-importing ATPase